MEASGKLGAREGAPVSAANTSKLSKNTQPGGVAAALAPAILSAGQPAPVPYAGTGQNPAARYSHTAAILLPSEHDYSSALVTSEECSEGY